jgi:D-alanine transaminase
MDQQIYFNGAFRGAAEKLLSIQDRGMTFGDGLFEVIRCVDGRFLLFSQHVQRMRESAASLRMALPFATEDLLEACRELSARNGLREGELYLELTRGEAPRYHPFPEGVPPTFFMILNPMRKLPEGCWSAGVATVTCQDLRGGHCHLKTLQLLANVLGKQYAKEQGAFEALFFREDALGRYLTEGPSSTIFAVRDGELLTPELDNILPGTTRKHVLALASRDGIPVREVRLRLEDFLGADEAFISSTVSEVMPVIRVDGASVGGGRKGPVTSRLQGMYAEFKAAHLE